MEAAAKTRGCCYARRCKGKNAVNLRHAAALVLTAFYLMLPPPRCKPVGLLQVDTTPLARPPAWEST
jgi:hypothetical protein